MYSSPPLIRTPLLSNNSVLIRERCPDEGKHYMHSQVLLLIAKSVVSFYRGALSEEGPLKEGLLYLNVYMILLWGVGGGLARDHDLGVTLIRH